MGKPRTTISCRICQRVEEVYLGRCKGCGMPAANVAIVNPVKTTRVRCPNCTRLKVRQLDNHGYICLGCHVEFEPVDFAFADDRPEHNAIKKGL